MQEIKSIKSAHTRLAEAVQARYPGENIQSGVKSKTGPDHCPTITVEILTPFEDFTMEGAPGQNQKQVLEELAVQILHEYPSLLVEG